MDKIDSLLRVIERYDHYIEIANNKANYLLAFVISLSVAIAALLGYSDILKFAIDTPFVNILKSLAILMYVANLFFVMQILLGVHRIIFPNTSSPSTPTKSIIFFGDVASLSHIEYADSVKRMTCEGFQDDLSFQANALAKIVGEKFNNQKRVMEITSRQYIFSALIISILCGIVKALS
ncbi:hypothetical protein [Pseudomonas sp. Marseille-Q5117]|jgi:hypothetical protein|uniref:hypothetical protein n=1 Tax=Pseudomonas sp. Marseille-Q5117 TaxID=2972777 RepID=UPI0021CAD49C|nr:hypothetical protein [Pseudomonas sp. Marseille-Q5117]